jgi:hypothetical protein
LLAAPTAACGSHGVLEFRDGEVANWNMTIFTDAYKAPLLPPKLAAHMAAATGRDPL